MTVSGWSAASAARWIVCDVAHKDPRICDVRRHQGHHRGYRGGPCGQSTLGLPIGSRSMVRTCRVLPASVRTTADGIMVVEERLGPRPLQLSVGRGGRLVAGADLDATLDALEELSTHRTEVSWHELRGHVLAGGKGGARHG